MMQNFQYGTPKMKIERVNFDPSWKYADADTNTIHKDSRE